MTPQPHRAVGRRPGTSPRLLATLGLGIAIAVAACGSTATPAPSAPSGSQAPAPSPSAAPVGIEHPTGSTDVVLRFEEGGGFVPVDFIATAAPSFTLYGDGTVVFRDPNGTPPPAVGNVQPSLPFQVVRLDEAAIQALLEQALGPGGLAVAEGPYMGLGADIPTATFTINVNGQSKQVSVVGLSPEMHPQNALIVGALATFAETLRTFGDRIGGAGPYRPAAYRGTLLSADQAVGALIAWPWPELTPGDFDGGENDFFRRHTLTAAQVAALGIPGVEGGVAGLTLQADDMLFSFALRPLLPDETE